MEVPDSMQDFLPLETTDSRTGNDGDEAGVVGKTGTCMVDTVAVVNQCEDMDWSVSQNCCDIPSEINDSLSVDETAKDSCSENTQDNSDRLNIKSEDGSCQKFVESRTTDKEDGSSRVCIKREVISESESGLPCGKDTINLEGSSDEDFFKDHEEFTDICSSYEYDSATLSENSQSILGNTNEVDIASCTVPSNSSCLQIKMEPEDKESVPNEDCLKDPEEFPDLCSYDSQSDASSENSQSILAHANETDIADNVVPSNSSCLQIEMEPENRKSSSNEDCLKDPEEFPDLYSYDSQSDASSENSQSILAHANETDIADNVVPSNSSCLQIKMEPENRKSSSNEDFLEEFPDLCSYGSDASNENSQSILENTNEADIADNVVPPNSSCLQIKMEPENKSNDTLGNSNENKSQVTSVVIHGSSQRQQGAKMQQQTLRSYSDKSTRLGNASNKPNARNNLKQSDIGVYFGLKPVERPALKNETPVASLTQNEQSKAGKDVPKGWASRKQCNLRSSQHTRKTAAGYSSSGGGDSTGSDSWHRPCPFYKKIQGMYLFILGNNSNNSNNSKALI